MMKVGLIVDCGVLQNSATKLWCLLTIRTERLSKQHGDFL